MTYGVRYRPDDNGSVVTLDNGRYIGFLGDVQPGNRSGSITTSKTIDPGSQVIIIPKKIVSMFDRLEGYSSNPFSIAIGSMSFSGNTLSYGIIPSKFPGWKDSGIFDVLVFQVSGAHSQDGYGIRIANGSNFMEVTDTSNLGFVTYRAQVDINNYWEIPSDILSLGNYVVFANWNNTTTPLYLNRDSNRIECYTGFSNNGGAVVGGSVSGVKIVIVSCGFSPGIPASGYGFVIRNAAGQVTASSKYPLVKWSGAAFNFSEWNQYGSGGEVLSWTGATGNIAGLPMVPLCSLGVQSGDFSQSSGGWTFRPALYAGMKMNGSQASSSRGAPTGKSFTMGQSPTASQVGISLPCLDTADYF